MKNLSLKKRLSCWLKGGKSIVVEAKKRRASLHVGISRSDMPMSPAQDCVVNITREVGKLRSDLNHFQTLSNEALMPLLPLIESHCNGLSLAVQQCNQIIERANAHRYLHNNPNLDTIH
ncbi:hypothetical protein V8C42DRAFT_224572 [Trichoderma barbatum]